MASSSRVKQEKKTKPRTRRAPEDAKALILDAADRVFAKKLPDVVGLKDVAREAGISHALITHYFKTYDGLVEAALERRFNQVREELVPVIVALVAGEADASEMLTAHRQSITRAAADPATVRLVIWASLSGRAGADDFFPHRMQGMKVLCDALEARSTASREDLEFLLIVSFALTTTWIFGRRAFLGSLGKKPTAATDEAFERRTDAMIEGFLRMAEAGGRRGPKT